MSLRSPTDCAPSFIASTPAGGTVAHSPDTGKRLGLALLAYMFGVTLIVTLLPFRFGWPSQWHVALTGDWLDIAANVVLFIPLGFFYHMARDGRQSLLALLGIAALASAAIESAQLFEATRDTTLSDIAANTLGAGVGALAYGRVARSATIDGRLVGWLALELPLMGLVYLLVPLLWVNSLAAANDTLRIASMLLLGIFGATLVGGMQRAYFAPWSAWRRARTAAFAALWFAAGALPSIPSRPLYVLIAAFVVGAWCWWLSRRTLTPSAPNRRFEVPLLKSAAPAYALYFALITIAPLAEGIGEWTLRFGFPAIASHQSEILRLLELVAAFTLLGYMIAEFGGRTLTRYRDALRRLVGWSLVLALAAEAVRGFDEARGASAAGGALLVAAALYGGWLYYLQRAHVIRLLVESGAGRG